VVDWDQFLTRGGTRIDFERVAEVGVGTVFGAIFTGVASVILGLADLPLALLGGLVDFNRQLIGVVAGLPAVIIERGFAAAVPFVLDAGIAGYLVAIVVVLATFYSLEWVVSRVGE
jgi:hypothetical protein